MSAAERRAPFDLSDAEGILGELKAIALLARMCTEHDGMLDSDDRDAVYFLACLATERIDQLDGMVQRASTR